MVNQIKGSEGSLIIMALNDKVALVTGGARGIGKAICEALLAENVKVCVTDILEPEGEETLRELIKTYGKENVIFHKMNVVDENEFEDYKKLKINLKKHVVVKTKQHFGHLDILCNNAGCANEAKPREIIEVNVIGVLNGIQMAHKYLFNSKGEKGGIVINIASIAGLQPCYILPVYSATKHAVVALTANWGHKDNVELTKVKVSSVCPNVTDTEMIPDLGTVDQQKQEKSKEVTLKFLQELQKPSDVANAVLKVIRDDVSGAFLYVGKAEGAIYRTLKEKDCIDEIYESIKK
uniref:15-hydroxyprostaglandin dehydrogenase [NAD(+)] n=1 Tax=Strigamia maritima TaxID=126957 RepID=T1JI24_STRMM